ncbi:hypothetical protein B0H16DRAFT_1362349 [Mycena metata]|uniref:F-box domain-containing protein n=1 Tax=Mycena metata TaxID=1033252 RepID=A0AAD7JZE3_9AGAR|nr:hypothetical protein B0H16DRAFT_1362349 [Mycena metata]
MSVQDLETRIEVLSAEIERQKEVLNQLERSKRAAQRELNTLRDPIAHLPLEISSEIFRHCAPAFPRPPNPRVVPMLLLNICNAWSTIALSTPALWVTLAIHNPCDELLQIWLQRARGYSLSVKLMGMDGTRELNKEITTVGKYSKQLKHLEIYGEEPDLDPFIAVGSFPHLETLEIGCLELDIDEVSITQIIHLLNAATNLVELTLHNISTFLDYNKEPALLRIRSLKFGTSTDPAQHNSHDDFLEYVSLPGLTTLLLAFNVISPLDFSLFLERSSPPLQRLGLGPGSYEITFDYLDRCFRIVPSLRHLELHIVSTCLGDLLLALASSSSELLPNLESLEMRYHLTVPLPIAYEVLLRALSVRRERLRRFGLKGENVDDPGQEVCNALKRLAADGMEIYIGSDDYNFISS